VSFAVFDGEGFILQVQGLFTRIRSGATAVASYGGALRSTNLRNGGSAHWWRFLARSARNGCKCVG
jgi:hypothetical protein